MQYSNSVLGRVTDNPRAIEFDDAPRVLSVVLSLLKGVLLIWRGLHS